MSFEFEILIDLIKSDHDKEYFAVDQLCGEFIMLNEFNISYGGEVLEYSADENHSINQKLDELIDKQCIVLRKRPIVPIPEFNAQSMIAFFDLWRPELDGNRTSQNEDFASANGFL